MNNTTSAKQDVKLEIKTGKKGHGANAAEGGGSASQNWQKIEKQRVGIEALQGKVQGQLNVEIAVDWLRLQCTPYRLA